MAARIRASEAALGSRRRRLSNRPWRNEPDARAAWSDCVGHGAACRAWCDRDRCRRLRRTARVAGALGSFQTGAARARRARSRASAKQELVDSSDLPTLACRRAYAMEDAIQTLTFRSSRRSRLAGCAIDGGLPVRSDLHDLPVAAEHRSFILHVPRSYRADRPTPLVILLHGHGAKAAAFERSTGMSDKADKESFIVAYPQALGSPSVWHTAVDGSPHGDDVAFIATLIDSAVARLQHRSCAHLRRRPLQRRVHGVPHRLGAIAAHRGARNLGGIDRPHHGAR